MQVRRLYPDARLPVKRHERAGSYALFAYARTESGRPSKLLIPPRTSRAVPCGVAILPPDGFLLATASGGALAAARSIFVANAPGIIDPHYRGEINILLYNGGHESHYISDGDYVGEIFLIPYGEINLEEI